MMSTAQEPSLAVFPGYRSEAANGKESEVECLTLLHKKLASFEDADIKIYQFKNKISEKNIYCNIFLGRITGGLWRYQKQSSQFRS